MKTLLVSFGMLLATMAVACGDDSHSPSSDGNTATANQTPVSTILASQPLPDGCTLLDDAAVRAAMGAAPAARSANRAATNRFTDCAWTDASNVYRLAIDVRIADGSNRSSFASQSAGFKAVAITVAEGRIDLAAPEPSRNYRSVRLYALSDKYLLYITVQGINRNDADATASMVAVAQSVLPKLP
jgi:hypothetical protein